MKINKSINPKSKKDQDLVLAFKEVIDYLAPLQTPTEQAVYKYLLRWSHFESGLGTIQVGIRTIARQVSRPAKGKLSKSKGLSYSTVVDTIRSLAKKEHIEIEKVEHEGTIYRVKLPREIPECMKLMKKEDKVSDNVDFKNLEVRKGIFERDNWTCFYCGEKVNSKNATLDHYIPQHLGGKNTRDNLKTCCLVCNSIKSGKTYEEASPFLLKSTKERKGRHKKSRPKNHSSKK
jgi:hypothetical protein